MLRRVLPVVLVAVLAACGSEKAAGPKKSGPAVATGNGITITAEEFKARLDEQSPFIRARYSTLERKKEFLDNLIRFEVLAKEATKQGLDKDPDVQLTLRKIMVQKLVQKNFADQSGAAALPDAELQKYYDDHKDEFQKAKKVRLAAIVLTAPAGAPDRAKKEALAKKALAQVKAAEKTNSLAFAAAVTQYSDDAATKAVSGDLNFKTKDELEKAYGAPLAEAAFALKPGELSGVIGTPQGFFVVKATGVQEEVNRPFDVVKAQIGSKLQREKKTKEFDELVKKLKEEAKVVVSDAELEKVTVSAAPPPGAPGMPGMPAGAANAMPEAARPPAPAHK
ncbi:MAG: peptidyl-prolyl cis-trans isomerase [Anaeromyxobacter sp.]|nr:peptidyl-prolyl cis-trans isomerase [Anaeromyxobacter sp.]MBL0278403.1 peptidyl-prolyl cis-trans isomerase [Anaeromyxobacter sp.]